MLPLGFYGKSALHEAQGNYSVLHEEKVRFQHNRGTHHLKAKLSLILSEAQSNGEVLLRHHNFVIFQTQQQFTHALKEKSIEHEVSLIDCSTAHFEENHISAEKKP